VTWEGCQLEAEERLPCCKPVKVEVKFLAYLLDRLKLEQYEC